MSLVLAHMIIFYFYKKKEGRVMSGMSVLNTVKGYMLIFVSALYTSYIYT